MTTEEHVKNLTTCDLQLLYNRDMHQVTIWVTITDTTPTAITGILNASEEPARSDSPQRPIGAAIRTTGCSAPGAGQGMAGAAARRWSASSA